jgi:hypothetical protein
MGSVRATLRHILGKYSGDQWRRLSFYIGVPLLLGIYGAMNNFHNVSTGYVGYFMFYLGHAMIPFWISCICTQLVTIVLAPWRLPLTIRLALGGAIAGFVVLPYASWLANSGSVDSGHAGTAFTLLSSEFILYSVRATLVWIGINLLFDRFLGLPRYRYPALDIPGKDSIDTLGLAAAGGARVQGSHVVASEVDKADGGHPELPAVLQLAPVPLQPEHLLAMCAEEHYVRLITTEGEFLVYHRFSDALKEVKKLRGLRVHRSHWVAQSSIVRVCRSAKKMFIELAGDRQVPVSRPYQAMVTQAAEQTDIPVCAISAEETFLP